MKFDYSLKNIVVFILFVLFLMLLGSHILKYLPIKEGYTQNDGSNVNSGKPKNTSTTFNF